MRVRFEEKILKGLLNDGDNKFVVSFLGSSVTAGHDTDFNMSFTELIGREMEPVLSKVNVKMVSRNAALGNNPCIPYDICVTPFAGQDVDVVHWEQSFNCGPNDGYMDVLEHFIRESISLPHKPLVVFVDSWQPNWHKDDCKDKKPVTITDSQKKMLQHVDSTPVEIVATLNKNILAEKFGGMTPFLEQYKAAGLQLWFHGFYEEYKVGGRRTFCSLLGVELPGCGCVNNPYPYSCGWDMSHSARVNT